MKTLGHKSEMSCKLYMCWLESVFNHVWESGSYSLPVDIQLQDYRIAYRFTQGHHIGFYFSQTPLDNADSEALSTFSWLRLSLDLPIALWIGKRTCTNHLIDKFVSYQLSTVHRCFAVAISFASAPKSIAEAPLSKKLWRVECPWEEQDLGVNRTAYKTTSYRM